MSKRIYNFSAGPATLPLSILEQAQSEFLNFQDQGMSIMEMSHRSKVFEAVLDKAKTGIQSLLNVPDTHDILFLQGGASLQFSMVPLNLKQTGKPVYAINTGSWTKKAIKEIKKEIDCNVIASSEDKSFSYIPSVETSHFDTQGSFAYLCSNNTIAGTQFKEFPNTADTPLVADMSSDILSRPLDIDSFGLIFAGAQKNVGPSGVTIVIVRKSLLERSSDQLPSMLNYRTLSESNSLYNTIPTFGVYMISLMTEWLKSQGGLDEIASRNKKKASKLYAAINESSYYYSPVAEKDQSDMNVVFRLNDSEEKEKAFYIEAEKRGLSGLKGHRSVGGLRASIYNAFPEEGITALIDFMHEFQSVNQRQVVTSA